MHSALAVEVYQCEVIVSVTSTAQHAGRVAVMCVTGLVL